MGPGRSSDLGSSAPRPFRIAPVDFRGASPFTAAGPFRIRTCFPFARRTRRNPRPYASKVQPHYTPAPRCPGGVRLPLQGAGRPRCTRTEPVAVGTTR